MSLISKADFMVSYDEETGVIYAPRKGSVKTTVPKHAKAIEEVLERYFSNQLSEEEKESFESYIEHSYKDNPDLPMMKYIDLKNRTKIRRLEIMVANDCNLNCRYCYACGGNYGRKAERMEPNQAVSYLDALLTGIYDEVDTVKFFGGEPTLCPDTIKVICSFFEEGVKKGSLKKLPRFTMVSNGTLIDCHMAEILSRYNIQVTISIDGPKEINDILRVDRGGNGSFERVERGIENLKMYNVCPHMLEATFTAKHREMGYTKTDIKEYLQNHFGIKRILVTDCEGDENCVLSEQEELLDNDWAYNYIFLNRNRFHKTLSCKQMIDVSCDAGVGSVALFPNGEIYPCHRFVNRWEYCIAQYGDGVFDFSNYDKVLEKLRESQKLNSTFCSECWAKGICCNCPANMLLLQDLETKKQFCQKYTQSQKQVVLIYAKEQILK